MELSYRQASELLGILRLSMSCGIMSKPSTPMDLAMIVALDMAVGALVEKQETEKAAKHKTSEQRR